MYGHIGHHIIHEGDKNRRRNNALAYDPKEYEFLLYFPLYFNHLEEYTQILWPQGLSTESVTEYKVWGFLFYQANWAKSKQGGKCKAVKTRIYTSNFDAEDCDKLLRIILMVTTALVENFNRSQFLGYY